MKDTIRKNGVKAVLFTVLCIACLVTLTACTQLKADDCFASWTEGAETLQALVDYVEDVTDEKSDNYIPVEDRIAVFDMDGTLVAELAPTYIEYLMYVDRVEQLGDAADSDMKDIAQQVMDEIEYGVFQDSLEINQATQNARVYAGMTISEFYDFVYSFLEKPVEGFNNMTYGTAWYQPMIEVVNYLNANDFTVYICSGTDRFTCRAIKNYAGVDIADNHVIGMDVLLEAGGQNGEPGITYQYTTGDGVVRTDVLITTNVKENKVSQITQEIGKQPVLTFGNSGGDKSMGLYTLDDNPYKSAVFMLVADDDVRDYGDPAAAAEKQSLWEECGFHVISMRNDFETIYGEGVEKTSR